MRLWNFENPIKPSNSSMKVIRTSLLISALSMATLSVQAQTDLCIDAFTNPFRSENFVQFSNGSITGIISQAGLEAGELARPVPPANDQIGEPVLFLGRTFENQNQNNLGGVLGGKRQTKFTRNSPNGNVSMSASAGKLSSSNSMFGNGTVVMHYGKASHPLNLNLGILPNAAFVLRNFSGSLATGNSVLVNITVTSSIGTTQHKTRTAAHSITANGDQIIPIGSPEFLGIDWSDVDRISLSLINSGSGGNQWEIQGFCVRSGMVSVPKMDAPAASAFDIFPVPATDFARIQFSLTQTSRSIIEVYDLNGRLVFRDQKDFEPGVQSIEIPVSDWAEGVYVVNALLGDEHLNRRMMVRH